MFVAVVVDVHHNLEHASPLSSAEFSVSLVGPDTFSTRTTWLSESADLRSESVAMP